MTEPNPPLSRDPRLIVLRIIWAALLFGQVVFAALVAASIAVRTAPPRPNPDTNRLLLVLAGAWLAIAIVAGFIARRVIFARGRGGDGAVRGEAFSSGTIIFLALCEGASFFGLITILISGRWWPGVIIPIIALFVQVLNIPTSGPLQPDPMAVNTRPPS